MVAREQRRITSDLREAQIPRKIPRKRSNSPRLIVQAASGRRTSCATSSSSSLGRCRSLRGRRPFTCMVKTGRLRGARPGCYSLVSLYLDARGCPLDS